MRQEWGSLRMERLEVRMRSQEIKGGGDRVVDWIWRLCNGFLRVVLSEERRSAVIVPLYKGKERGENAAIIEVLAC